MNGRQRFPRYHQLLRLYPAAYRRKYGDQVLQTLADMLDNAPATPQKRLIWLRVALDFPRSILKENIINLGGIMVHEMPHYVKNNSLIGALMLLPFFVIVGVSSLVHDHLYDTFLWNNSVLITWLLVLPTLAVILSLTTFTRWFIEYRRQGGRGFWRSLFDLPHNWPMLGVSVLALGIIGLAFFHDSVHCVTGNPVRELQQWHNTWNCIQQR